MKRSKPAGRVAVITRTRDRPLFLRRAIASVLGQTHADWLHVMVNDGGDPAPVDLLAREHATAYRGRLQVVHLPHSVGMQNASNAGIEASASACIAIHDDDDSWQPEFLERTLAALDDAPDGVDGVVCQTTQIFEEITVDGTLRELKRAAYMYFEFAGLNEMRRHNQFPPIAFLYRRRVHAAIGMFRQEFDVLGDHDFNLRFLRRHDIRVIPEFLANYHWRQGYMGNTVTNGVHGHRLMLNRLKNRHLRAWLDHDPDAVGDLDAIAYPPARKTVHPPFVRRAAPEPPPPPPDPFAGPAFACLSLDVFDTALRRRCNRPTDVFQFLEQRLRARHGLPARPYAQARAAAERMARDRAGGEVTLAEIYQAFAELCELDPATAALCQGEERAIERELAYADPRVLAWAQQALAAGHSLVYVSDMYLPAADIAALLQACGYPEAPVHVSCEHGCAKHDGRLFARVAAALGLAPEAILHIGDNRHADFVRAREAGWQALHYEALRHVAAPLGDEVEPFYHQPGDLWSLRAFGEVRRAAQSAPDGPPPLLERLGFEVAGPLYLAFLQWLVGAAGRLGLRKLLLLGRDGYYWEKTLHLLAGRLPPGLEFSYFHSSRKVLNFASFNGLDDAALEFLLTPHPSLSANDFIERLGLDAAPYAALFDSVGLDDPARVLTHENGGRYLDPRDADRMRVFFRCIRADLEPLFAADRAALQAELRQHSFDLRDCAIVDVGWAASSAKALSRLLGATPAEPLHAFYFGTWKEAGPQPAAYALHSWFMHLGASEQHAMLLAESINLIELLHGAPFPTLTALRLADDGSVEPVFDKGAMGGFSPAQQAEIWHGAEMFIRAMLERDPDLCGASPGNGFNYLFLTLHRLLREPAPAEVATWGFLRHSDGFGLERQRPLVIKPPEGQGPDALLATFTSSRWRRGFLALLDKQQADFVQARTAPLPPKTYEELAGDLRWQTAQADRLWAENQQLKAQADSGQHAQRELQAAREELARRALEVTGLHGEVDRLSCHVDDLRVQRDECRRLADVAQELRLTAQNEARAYREQVEAELARLRGSVPALETRVAELVEAMDERNASLDVAQAAINARDAALAKAHDVIGERDDALQTAQQAIHTRDGDLERAHAELSAKVAALAQEQAQLAEVQAQLAETQAQLAEAQAQLAEAQAQLVTAQAQLADTQAQLADVREQLATAHATIGQHEDLLRRPWDAFVQAWRNRRRNG
jgi:glycosyltransferase involved in cell wall biosynthesis